MPYRGFSQLLSSVNSRFRSYFSFIFWAVTGCGLLWLTWLALSAGKMDSNRLYSALMAFIGFFLLIYLPKLLFIVFTLLKDVVSLLANGSRLLLKDGSRADEVANTISRSDFLIKTGLVLSALPFLSIFWGIVYGRYNYTVKRVKLSFPDLPEAFSGFRFVQISDIHLGSFKNPEHVEEAVERVNELNPDYIFFTGDMVNTLASEMDGYIPILKKLKAKKEKFSILGNHDYGDYHQWDSPEEKKSNLETLFEYEKQAGFRLLRNESVILEQEGEKIALIGVENWGLPPFPQYGDLNKAMKNVVDIPFKILLSHDPSHWDAKVRKNSHVQLTLSGHTHGMQFAIRIPGWQWSPVKYKYPRWAGLYKEGRQLLYVNIGLGFIAFPGRVGTPPEITLFELESVKKG